MVGLQGVDDVRDGVFVIGVVFRFVAGDVDVDVGVPSLGVDVVVCVGCVEEVEVWYFVGCDTDWVSCKVLNCVSRTRKYLQFAIGLVQNVKIYGRVVLALHRFDNGLSRITSIHGNRLFTRQQHKLVILVLPDAS